MSREQPRENLAAVEIHLTEEDMTKLDEFIALPLEYPKILFQNMNRLTELRFLVRILLPMVVCSTPLLAAQAVPVGGADVVHLKRAATSHGKQPEFLSVTLLPGRGMNVFQITADIPGRGETPLLKSPSVEEAARQLTGTGKDRWGNLNHSFGGAFLIPFSSRITGELSADGELVTTKWQGATITLPANSGKFAVHGLLNEEKAQDLRTIQTAGGQTETAVIHAGDFGGHWPSATDLHFTVALTGDAVDIQIRATNAGKSPEPMAIGWHPYFSIPSGMRNQVRLHVPAERRALVNPVDARTTGEFEPVAGTAFDFRSAQGGTLDDSINVNLSQLDRTHGSADAWLRDPKTGYAIRVRAMSPQIQTIHIYSPRNDTFVAIEDQFNYPDPWGAEWKGMNTGMIKLEPGQSVTWRVRLELF
jgi:aldose 1-epimerase